MRKFRVSKFHTQNSKTPHLRELGFRVQASLHLSLVVAWEVALRSAIDRIMVPKDLRDLIPGNCI